ncbi:hypothetical protein J2X20_005525 [Pelomonas saccharophila]|uniref:Uncharacterized protein n=1 Tax=Roseateles saccharophilus TaxID=304 RepID=A0ABU1YX67_ROSSA|nr:hypothetical protein [Roseateles saccharophilus]MDR7272840.1 hypothetical protein [Roseateles saccharophilus]
MKTKSSSAGQRRKQVRLQRHPSRWLFQLTLIGTIVTKRPFLKRLAFLACAALTIIGVHILYRLWNEDGSSPTPADRPPKVEPLQLPAPAPSSGVIETPASSAPVPRVSSYRGTSLYSGSGRIGSEGYAPIVRTALASGTPSDALRAFFILNKCNDVQKDMERLLRNRSVDLSRRQSENQTRLIEENLAEQRACQTIDQEILSMRSALLLKSIKGGELGAASIYLTENLQSKSILETDKKAAIEQLLIDANLGHRLSIMMAAIDGVKNFGITSDDQLVYQAALKLILNDHPDELVSANGPLANLLNMLFDDVNVSTKSGANELEAKVRKVVNAHIRLKQQGKE